VSQSGVPKRSLGTRESYFEMTTGRFAARRPGRSWAFLIVSPLFRPRELLLEESVDLLQLFGREIPRLGQRFDLGNINERVGWTFRNAHASSVLGIAFLLRFQSCAAAGTKLGEAKGMNELGACPTEGDQGRIQNSD